MKKTIQSITLLSSLLFLNLTLHGQKSDTTTWWSRVLDRFVHEDLPPDKPRLLVYPTFAFSPETNLEIGAAAALLFHAKNDIVNNRLSEITAFTFITLRSQYGFWFENAVYTDQDRWLLLGRSRVQRFPLLYFGVGPDVSGEEPDIVDGFGVQLRHRAFHKIIPNLFAGVQFDYQSLRDVEFGEEGIATRPLPRGAGGSANFGVGVGVAYDSRPNALNTRNGWFAELGWLQYSRDLGSEYAFHNYNLDVRWYRSFRPRQVLAAQVIGNIVTGDAPFNQLSLLGSEGMMRGYYTGRFRDQQHYAAQMEYRWLPLPFSKRIGAVTFLSAGTVAPRLNALHINNLRIAGGAGLRFLLFPKKDIFLRFDLGMTNEGPGFYIFTGEAF
jgi:outer membrane protein assembly factor BamA